MTNEDGDGTRRGQEQKVAARRHIRIKIPRENAKVVTAEEMRMLQIEAAAKLFH